MNVRISRIGRHLPVVAGVALIAAAVLWLPRMGNEGHADVVFGSWAQVSAGGMHTCALDGAGKVSCWGEAGGEPIPSPEGTFSQISSGGAHACGLMTSGGTLSCWGRDFLGSTKPPAGKFIQVSAGWDYSCAIREGGAVACWGWNEDGQASPPAGSFTSIAAGYYHTCGILRGGAVRCWGSSESFSGAPDGTFTQVVVGKEHTCGLRPGGQVVCWGANPGGLGPQGAPPPKPDHGRTTPPEGKFKALSGGYDHTCAVKAGGEAICWGHNAVDQARAPNESFQRVSAGFFHSCGIREDESLHCWGWRKPLAVIPDVISRLKLAHKAANLDTAFSTAGAHHCPYQGLGLLYLRQNRMGLMLENLNAVLKRKKYMTRLDPSSLGKLMAEVLTPREREVLAADLGAGDVASEELKRLAREYKVEEEQIRDIERHAYTKLEVALSRRKKVRE